jgi:hypothetical protein
MAIRIHARTAVTAAIRARRGGRMVLAGVRWSSSRYGVLVDPAHDSIGPFPPRAASLTPRGVRRHDRTSRADPGACGDAPRPSPPRRPVLRPPSAAAPTPTPPLRQSRAATRPGLHPNPVPHPHRAGTRSSAPLSLAAPRHRRRTPRRRRRCRPRPRRRAVVDAEYRALCAAHGLHPSAALFRDYSACGGLRGDP